MAKIIDLIKDRNLITLGALKSENAVEIKIPENIDVKKDGEQETIQNVTNRKDEVEVEEQNSNFQYKDLFSEERNKGLTKVEIAALELTKTNNVEIEGRKPSIQNLTGRHLDAIDEAKDASKDNLNIQTVTPAKLDKVIDTFDDTNEASKIQHKDIVKGGFFVKAPTQIEISKITPEQVDKKDVANRVNDKQMIMFLYNALPYIGTRAVAGAQIAVNSLGNPKLLGIVSALKSVGSFLKKVKYFTIIELIKTLAHNFYTLHFTRGITIKKGQGGFMFLTLPGKDWDGMPDITYGRNFFNFNLFAMLRARLRKLFTLPKGANNLTPSERDNYELSQFKPGVITSMSDIDYNTKSTVLDLQIDQRKIETYGINIKTDPDAILDTAGEEKFQIPRGVRSKSSKPTEDDLGPSYEETRFIDVINRAGLYHTKNNNLEILYSEKKGATKDDIIMVTLPSGEEKTVQDAISKKTFLKTEGGHWQIGAILVMPITSVDLERFYIPFEFNPIIELGGVSARYQSNSYLSRIGNLQTFTGVDSQTVIINVKYYAVSHDETTGTIDGSGWMNNFTLKKIQAIELAYNSLVLPHFPQENKDSIKKGYKYIKPPLIKIIMGGKKDTSPYSNLLTYQKDSIVKNHHLKNDPFDKFYKTFIVTSVQINKHMEDYPLYLDEEDLKILDTFGFDVSLNLTEVTPGYMDIVPDFKDLSDGYLEVMQDFKVG